MFGGSRSIPLTIRCIIGKGWGQGPQHSQSLHAICSHFPGLRVSLPSTPYQAKGLLLNSIFSNDPSILFEARSLFDLKEEIPSEPYVVPFGKATVVQEGTALTLAATSYLTIEAKKIAALLSQSGYSIEVVDITSSNPIDY
jgi:pyruvate dehydrogenase E1 component beta subunit